MKRPRAIILTGVAVIALALLLGACGGDGDDEGKTTSAPSSEFAPPSGGAPPSAGALPPVLVQCFADKGFNLESPTEIHSAPRQVVQECFGLLHQGGAP
jgi:hypothetical protein